MVRAEPRNNHTGIDTNHSTMFTLLLELNVIFEQRWVQLEFQNSPSRVLDLMTKYTLPLSKPVKSDHNSNFWYFQNNHIETTKLFSVGSSPDPPISKKIAVRSSPDPAKIGFSLDPVRSSTDRCSSLLHTWQRCTGSGFQNSSPAGFSSFWTNRIRTTVLFKFPDQDYHISLFWDLTLTQS